MTIDYDNLPAEIDRLHDAAEELSAIAKRTPDAGAADDLKADAKRLIVKAARLRAQIEEA